MLLHLLYSIFYFSYFYSFIFSLQIIIFILPILFQYLFPIILNLKVLCMQTFTNCFSSLLAWSFRHPSILIVVRILSRRVIPKLRGMLFWMGKLKGRRFLFCRTFIFISPFIFNGCILFIVLPETVVFVIDLRRKIIVRDLFVFKFLVLAVISMTKRVLVFSQIWFVSINRQNSNILITISGRRQESRVWG